MQIETLLHAEHQLDQCAGQFAHGHQIRSHPHSQIPPALWAQAVALPAVVSPPSHEADSIPRAPLPLRLERSRAACCQPPPARLVGGPRRSGQWPGWPQCWTIAWRRPGSSVMMPSTPAPTRAQRSLAVVNGPDNEAQACLHGPPGVDRIAPPEFCDDKRLPGLEGHHSVAPTGQSACRPADSAGRPRARRAPGGARGLRYPRQCTRGSAWPAASAGLRAGAGQRSAQTA